MAQHSMSLNRTTAAAAASHLTGSYLRVSALSW